MNKVALSLGSNLGDRKENIKKAVNLLENKFKTKFKKSPVYETPPLYYNGPEFFYNCCVVFETELSPDKIFEVTSSVEEEIGRTKKRLRNVPRLVDVDVILIGDNIIANDKITVPHPGMQDRLFVLKPLSEIAKNFVHPVVQLTVGDLLYECPDKSKIKKLKNFWGDE